MKGTARPTKVYLAKKRHPLRWRISKYLKAIADWINGNDDLFIKEPKDLR